MKDGDGGLNISLMLRELGQSCSPREAVANEWFYQTEDMVSQRHLHMPAHIPSFSKYSWTHFLQIRKPYHPSNSQPESYECAQNKDDSPEFPM